jgi:hypothetical protein
MSTLSTLTTTESTFEEKLTTTASTLADEDLGDWRTGWVPGL